MTILLAAALVATVFTFFWVLLLVIPYVRACAGSAIEGYTPFWSALVVSPAVILSVWLWSMVLS